MVIISSSFSLTSYHQVASLLLYEKISQILLSCFQMF
uniref:Uncharacterized protein n=1 Tax=Arundo donax TaxID=35708 RepID=A0A0A8YL40_ARUDO